MFACMLCPLAASAADDPALVPVKVNFAPGKAYASETRKWQGIPGIERAPNGRLWALWYTGGKSEGPDNYVVLVTSGDDGKTWSPPVLVIDPPGPVRAYDPTLWHDPDGKLWLFWAQSYNWWDGRSGVWAITTRQSGKPNPTWTRPRRLTDGIMMNKPTVLTSGLWVLPAAIWEGKPRTDKYAHDLGEKKGGRLVASADHGKTWTLLGSTRVPKRVFDEHMLIERRDGTLWTLVRTSYGMGQSISKDGGRTWTEGGPSGIRNANARFHIRRLRSGRLLLVHHDPPAKPGSKPRRTPGRSHLTAHLSDDDGETWKGGLLIDGRGGVSYPDAVETPEGLIYLIYDYSRHGAKEILLATFTEADVLAGQNASGKLRLRVLVNKAGVKPGASRP